MANVNFYLKKPDTELSASLIYLQFKYNGKKLVYSFGQNIDADNWNPKKQRVKSNKTTTADGKYSLNDLLDNLAKECDRAYNTELKNGRPVPATLKQYLVDFMNRNETPEDGPTLYKLIDRFTKNEIKYQGRDKSKNTIKTYNTTLGHLKEFEKKERYPVDFENITLDFYYKFVSFLKKKELGVNAISKDIQIIKVFMSEAVDLGYTNNLQFKHKKFAVSRVETDAIYLTEAEIMKLYEFDFSDNKRLEQVRDLFVFGCCVGLRFSDYSDIKPENLIKIDNEYFIKQITKKTGELVIIPCNPIVIDIFNRYSHNANKLPKSYSNQKFNNYIKEACQKAKLNEKGRLATDPGLELRECVSSHTARRSFATNLYLDGFPTIDLMKITGHRTERAFLKYIRVTKLDTAKRLNEHIKKNWSKKLLRVAS